MDSILGRDDATDDTGYTEKHEQVAAIADSERENEIIGAVKDSRRASVAHQDAVAGARSAAIQKILDIKAGKFPTLEGRIKKLEYLDAEMYKYIRFLESLGQLNKTAPNQ